MWMNISNNNNNNNKVWYKLWKMIQSTNESFESVDSPIAKKKPNNNFKISEICLKWPDYEFDYFAVQAKCSVNC